MKYIRTADGKIIDLTDKDYIVNGKDLILHEQHETVGSAPCEKGSMMQLAVAIITKHNEYHFVGTIEKQADNIKDLCDLFVYEIDDDGFYNNHLFCPPYSYDLFVETTKISDVAGVFEVKSKFGAVWTKTGLIYVAKLNEKGEWELL